MHKRLTIILLLLVVGLTTCNRGRSPVALGDELSAAEYGMFSAYIAGKFTGTEGKRQVGKDIAKTVIIFDTTQSGDDDPLGGENGRPIPWEKTAGSLRKNAPALQQATIDAFREANVQQASLRRSFHLPIDYELVDSTQLESIVKKNGGGWPAYYRRFPGSQGILTFSRAGFGADGTQALFYLSNRCGALCGTGEYVVMEKRNGRWVIGKEIEMWIS